MRRTVALFALALLLVVVAVVVGVRGAPAPSSPSTPTPVPTTDFTPPRDAPHGPTASAIHIGDVVELDGRLSNGFVRRDDTTTLSLLIDLFGRNDAASTRSAAAVAIVIDRSGSMQGEKISRARSAAKQFAARLGDDDQIAIVSYSSDFSVDLPLTALKGQRSRVERVVNEILDGGGTDIGAGLEAGIQALRRAPSGTNRRLFLVSDGNANQGITDPTALVDIARRARQDGITVSTLGVGLDFNEDLLAHMAQDAGGSYAYARDAEAIDAAFDRELAGVSHLAARQVEVGLELGRGVEIREVFGYRTETKGSRVVVPVGDIAAGEHRRVLIQLSCTPSADRMDVARIVLGYTSASDQGVREHQGTLAVMTTDRDAEVVSGERHDVAEAVEAAYAARTRAYAAARFQAGHKAQAIQQLETQINLTRSRNADLKSPTLDAQVKEMQEAIRGISAASAESDEAKDLVKSEKLRARQVFAY